MEVTPVLMKLLASGRRDDEGLAWLCFRLAGKFDEGGTFSPSGSKSIYSVPLLGIVSVESPVPLL